MLSKMKSLVDRFKILQIQIVTLSVFRYCKYDDNKCKCMHIHMQVHILVQRIHITVTGMQSLVYMYTNYACCFAFLPFIKLAEQSE